MSDKKPTRANIQPPRSSRSFLPDTPPPSEASDNMSAEELMNMTFTVPRDFRTRFKMTAFRHNLSMKDLLFEAFALWEKTKEEKR